jgi:hypothetical protein
MNTYDKMLIVVLLFVALSFSVVYRNFIKEEGSYVVVTVDGEEVNRLSLSEDTQLLIEGANGGTNRLVIQDGVAKMEEASCPDLLCVRQRKICYNEESIICLPNKVVVRVVGGSDDEVDAIQ